MGRQGREDRQSPIKDALDKDIEGMDGFQKENDEWVVLVDVLERKSVPDIQDLGKPFLVSAMAIVDTGESNIHIRELGDVLDENQLE